jgi:hypothetical protein
MIRFHYKKRKDWDKSGDPVKLLEKATVKNLPNMYMTVGSNDDFKFDVNGKVFAELAITKGAKMEFVFHDGDHFEFDVAKLANFLMKEE